MISGVPHPPPHAGGMTGGFEQFVVITVHEELQLNVHRLYQKLEQVCPLRFEPSQSSPVFILPFPQVAVGIFEQLVVSNIHEGLQLSVHVSNHWLTQSSLLRFEPSQSSPVSMLPFPQSGGIGHAGSTGSQIRSPLILVPVVQMLSIQSQASPVDIDSIYSVLVYANHPPAGTPHHDHCVQLVKFIS